MWFTNVVLTTAIAASPAAQATPASLTQPPVRIGLQSVIAPFVLSDNSSGLLVDVLRAAFETQHMPVEFRYLPNARFEEQFRLGLLDVTTGSAPNLAQQGYLGHWPVSHFQNVAITLRSKIPSLSKLEDLKKYRVTAFRSARKVLGPGYVAATANHPAYRETVTMPSGGLFLDRTDVIISQPDIFLYYLRQQLPQRHNAASELAYHDVLGPGRFYWMRFRTAGQRDAFERGVAQLYASGEIDRILARYQRDYGITRDFFIALDCRFRPQLAPQKCKQLSQQWNSPP